MKRMQSKGWPKLYTVPTQNIFNGHLFWFAEMKEGKMIAVSEIY